MRIILLIVNIIFNIVIYNYVDIYIPVFNLLSLYTHALLIIHAGKCTRILCSCLGPGKTALWTWDRCAGQSLRLCTSGMRKGPMMCRVACCQSAYFISVTVLCHP